MKSKPPRATQPSLTKRYTLIVPALLVLTAIAFSGRSAAWRTLSRLGLLSPLSTNSESPGDSCSLYNYQTEIVSIDPLLIYIHNFISPSESDKLMNLAKDSFEPSPVFQAQAGRQQQYGNPRTSESAWIDMDASITQCVLSRARSFMGSMLPKQGEFGNPQLVRYSPGQKFDQHADWISRPQYTDVRQADGNMVKKRWNRIASFFVFVRARCEGGETHFPFVNGTGLLTPGLPTQSAAADVRRTEAKIKKHKDGGLAFTPVEGNALFWVNLLPDGTGDKRVVHAGLPVESGWKVGMNIWPRIYFED